MKKRGVTLIELLVVIIIIGLLTGVLIPALWHARDEAHKAKAAIVAHERELAERMYTVQTDGRVYRHVSRTRFGENWMGFQTEAGDWVIVYGNFIATEEPTRLNRTSDTHPSDPTPTKETKRD